MVPIKLVKFLEILPKSLSNHFHGADLNQPTKNFIQSPNPPQLPNLPKSPISQLLNLPNLIPNLSISNPNSQSLKSPKPNLQSPTPIFNPISQISQPPRRTIFQLKRSTPQ